jgi:hypothetical protein
MVEGLDPGSEGRFRLVIARTAVAGQAANLLHEGDGRIPFRFADHTAEHVGEEADVSAQQVVGHGRVRGMGGSRHPLYQQISSNFRAAAWQAWSGFGTRAPELPLANPWAAAAGETGRPAAMLGVECRGMPGVT